MSTLVFVGTSDTSDAVELALQFDQCWMFEPLVERAWSLKQKLQNHHGAWVFPLACAESSGVREFNVYNINGLSSSLNHVTDDAIQRFSRFDLSLRETRSVLAVNLNEFLPDDGFYIDYLKLDAQGMDLAILETLEPRLRAGRIGRICTEADAAGFQHYDGPDNSFEAQREYLSQFDYAGDVDPTKLAWHPDVEWERNETHTAIAELGGWHECTSGREGVRGIANRGGGCVAPCRTTDCSGDAGR